MQNYTIKQASKAIGKSEITVRRFIEKHSNELGTDIYFSRGNYGSWLIDSSFLHKHYPHAVDHVDGVMNDKGMTISMSKENEWLKKQVEQLQNTNAELVKMNTSLIESYKKEVDRFADLKIKATKLYKYYLAHKKLA